MIIYGCIFPRVKSCAVIMYWYYFCVVFFKQYANVFRDQDDIRTAKGDAEITLYNTKKRRIIYSSCRVGFLFISVGGLNWQLDKCCM